MVAARATDGSLETGRRAAPTASGETDRAAADGKESAPDLSEVLGYGVVLEPGRILSGKYRLEAEIGRGGMGSVWRATRLDLGTRVAVKVMHGQPSDNPVGFDRFGREAKAAASLNSPHVVRIIDFGLDAATHTPFITMELLEGESLAQRIDSALRLAPAVVARVITQVARALSEAHAAGIVHRDLKPANIFLVRNADEELVKLLDFGVAKAAGGVATATGHVLGTPYYMSPEQVNSLKDIDHRADLWSLAVIASECVTGRKPFMAETLSELAMKISLGRAEVPSSVAPVPTGFDAWFARGTSVDPAGRFQTATQLALELQTVLKGERVEASAPARLAFAATQRLESTAQPPPDAPPATPAPERARAAGLSTTARGSALSTTPSAAARRWPWPFAAATLLAIVGGLGVLLSSARHPAPPLVEAHAALGVGSEPPTAVASTPADAVPAANAANSANSENAANAAATALPATHAASANAVSRGSLAASTPAAAGPSAETPAARGAHAATRTRTPSLHPPRPSKAPKAPRSAQPLDHLDAYDTP